MLRGDAGRRGLCDPRVLPDSPISPATVGADGAGAVWLAATTLAYLVFLYFNFAGYTSIVIGIGRMLGMQVPENFDLPWASKSFLDLWARWHMTLAQCSGSMSSTRS